MNNSNGPIPTARLLQRWRTEPNPVTRSVLADIIGNRIDSAMSLIRRQQNGILK